jgi:hypothetical protein
MGNSNSNKKRKNSTKSKGSKMRDNSVNFDIFIHQFLNFNKFLK